MEVNKMITLKTVTQYETHEELKEFTFNSETELNDFVQENKQWFSLNTRLEIIK